MPSTTFSLLVFHGSAREAAGNAATLFADKLRTSIRQSDFTMCFLRGAEPDLDSAIANAIAKGHKKLRLLPLFLLPGSHTSEEIPAIVDRFRKDNPDVEFDVCACLVQNPMFVEFVADQITRD